MRPNPQGGRTRIDLPAAADTLADPSAVPLPQAIPQTIPASLQVNPTMPTAY